GRFDKSIHAFGIRKRYGHRDAAIWFFWETFVGLSRDLCPCVAAVRGPEQSAGGRRGRTFAARAVLPAFAPEIPHCGKHDVGIARVDFYIGATRRKICSFENLFHVLPPSVVLYRPRSGESLHKA